MFEYCMNCCLLCYYITLDWWPFNSGRSENVGTTEGGGQSRPLHGGIPWAVPLTSLAVGVVFGPSS